MISSLLSGARPEQPNPSTASTVGKYPRYQSIFSLQLKCPAPQRYFFVFVIILIQPAEGTEGQADIRITRRAPYHAWVRGFRSGDDINDNVVFKLLLS